MKFTILLVLIAVLAGCEDSIKSTMPRVCEMCLTGASITMSGSSIFL